MKVLVLGADSSVGSKVFQVGQGLGQCEVSGTTRRSPQPSGSVLPLDLLDEATWEISLAWRPDVVVAFFAVSNLKDCEVDQTTYDINVRSVTTLLHRFSLQGAAPIFISTNSVFGGGREKCSEDDPVSPNLAYSRQKVEAESILFENAKNHDYIDRLSVIRITRVLTAQTAPFPSWVSSLRHGEPIEAFTDFIFSPISDQYVSNAIYRMIECGKSGIFHLSGDKDISYFEMVDMLRNEVGGGTVAATTSEEKGVEVLFLPKYSALGMERTEKVLGIKPQPAQSVISDLLPLWRCATP